MCGVKRRNRPPSVRLNAERPIRGRRLDARPSMPDTAKDAKLLHHRLGYDPLDNTLRGKFQSWYPDLSHVQNAVSSEHVLAA